LNSSTKRQAIRTTLEEEKAATRKTSTRF